VPSYSCSTQQSLALPTTAGVEPHQFLKRTDCHDIVATSGGAVRWVWSLRVVCEDVAVERYTHVHTHGAGGGTHLHRRGRGLLNCPTRRAPARPRHTRTRTPALLLRCPSCVNALHRPAPPHGRTRPGGRGVFPVSEGGDGRLQAGQTRRGQQRQLAPATRPIEPSTPPPTPPEERPRLAPRCGPSQLVASPPQPPPQPHSGGGGCRAGAAAHLCDTPQGMAHAHTHTGREATQPPSALGGW